MPNWPSYLHSPLSFLVHARPFILIGRKAVSLNARIFIWRERKTADEVKGEIEPRIMHAFQVLPCHTRREREATTTEKTASDTVNSLHAFFSLFCMYLAQSYFLFFSFSQPHKWSEQLKVKSFALSLSLTHRERESRENRKSFLSATKSGGLGGKRKSFSLSPT